MNFPGAHHGRCGDDSANGDYTIPVPDLSPGTRRPTVPGSHRAGHRVPGVRAVLRAGHRPRVDVCYSLRPRPAS
jgi:hypothetical protein